jgi:hypothetical protein
MNSREFVILAGVALIVLVGGLLFFALLWGVGGMGFGIMGPSMMGPGTAGGIGVVGLLACLMPIGLAVLVALGAGAVWLFQRNGSSSSRAWSPPPSQEAAAAVCPSCGRSVEPDWQVCPYCGTPLQEDAA